MHSFAVPLVDTPASLLILGKSQPANGHNSSKKDVDAVHKSPTRQSRILIVEDELLVAENLKEILLADGDDVINIVSSGEEALENFNEINPDLILMDVRLSGAMDGIQTAIAIHERFRQLPILFITAYGQEQFEGLAALRNPFFYFFVKPYDPAQITDCIDRLMKTPGNRPG